jgi:hypothetical protein
MATENFDREVDLALEKVGALRVLIERTLESPFFV